MHNRSPKSSVGLDGKLTIAKLNPTYKKEERLFTNYRPISQLPAISKVFEK